MNTINEDIKNAQNIITGNFPINRDTPYSSSSFIYRVSNENSNDYQIFLKNRENVASVIASSDQIFNSCFEGPSNVTGFDISRFPFYFLELKMAGLDTFSLDDFLKFFYIDNVEAEQYDDMYFEMRESLDKNSKKFWDALFNFYDWPEVTASSLFSSEPFSLKSAIDKNIYLQSEDNFNTLKNKISNIHFDFAFGDICLLAKNLPREYDFVNLSSIIYYKKLDEYYKMLEELPLTEHGQALTYLYEADDAYCLDKENYSITQFDDKKSGVLIYTKKKEDSKNQIIV